MRNPEAYEEPFRFLQDEATEIYAVRTAFKNQVWRFFFEEALRVIPQADIAARMGVMLVSLQNHVTALTLTLTRPCSTNVVRCIANLHEGCTRTCYRESQSIWESSTHHLPKAEQMCTPQAELDVLLCKRHDSSKALTSIIF